MSHDPVNSPKHYTSHPSGIECIQIAEHFGFNLGNALKYIWRADLKDNADEDLRKAAFYIARELKKRASERIEADSLERLPSFAKASDEVKAATDRVRQAFAHAGAAVVPKDEDF